MRIVYERDGRAVVITPAPGCGLTVEEIAAKDVPARTAFQIVPASSIPTSRTFRNAWAVVGDKVDVDMPAARTIHMDRIRAERDKELTSLDLEYMQADEAGDAAEKAVITSAKRTLREIPQTFDLTTASTPEDLEALWPAELTRR